MGDEAGGFDPCECVWGHEMAMRRLLSVLRNSQAYCTENLCLTNDISPRQTNPDQVLLMSLFFITAVFLYYFRPRPQAVEGPSKPSNTDQNGAPPSPPPAMN